MSKTKVLISASILLFAVSGALAIEPLPETEIHGLEGVKLEIYQRPPKAKKPGEKRQAPPRKPPVPVKFPGDLTVSDDLPERTRNWFPWDPTGVNNFPTSTECTQDSLRDLIWKNRKACDQGKAINGWIERCGNEISSPFSRHSFVPLIKYATMTYDFLDNPYVHAVKATLPDGRMLTGFVAMKPDDKPRPFIIAKCGVFCNAEQSTTHRAFMMHLFDESPFHVLTLANITGSDFQKTNKAFSVGGFDEGRQLYQIAQLVRSPDSPIAHRISSVHVMGASLGGNGALYSGLYSSLNDPPGIQSIQSVTAVCPVVVVENSAKRLYSAKPISTVATFETLNQIKRVFSFVPVLGKILPEGWHKLRGSKLYSKITEAIFEYYRDWTAQHPWDLKPFVGTKVTSIEQFWKLNDFRYYMNDVRVPTLTIAAENDGLVKVDGNSKLLMEALKKTPSDYLDTVFFKQGNHCAFGLANGWGNYSMLLREYVLTHSPEALDHWKPRTVRLEGARADLIQGERVVQATWQAHETEEFMELTYTIFSSRMTGESMECSFDRLYKADSRCYRQQKISIPLRDLPLPSKEPPMGDYEVTSLTRFANTRFSLLNKDHELAVNSPYPPEYVQVWEWR